MSDILFWVFVLGYIYETDNEQNEQNENKTISNIEYSNLYIETCPKLLKGKYEYIKDIKNNNYKLNKISYKPLNINLWFFYNYTLRQKRNKKEIKYIQKIFNEEFKKKNKYKINI